MVRDVLEIPNLFSKKITMRKKFLCSVLLCLSISANAKNSAKKNDRLDEMRAKYKNVKSLTAEFEQKIKNAALGSTKESSGRIYIKRPNMFRWETHEPQASILVGNGRKVWFYTPPFREDEKGQVMAKKAADVQSRLAIDLLSGQAALSKSFKIKELKNGVFDLVPLKPSGDIAHIALFLEKSTNLVYKLTLYTITGNETELTLKKLTLGTKPGEVSLADSMFNFTPPPNTEEIQ